MANPSPAVKHHFWILFAAAPLFIGLAFLLMLILVSGEITAKQKEFEDTKKALTDAKPKTNGDLKAMGDQLSEQEVNRTILWSQSYQEQLDAGVFTWPDSRHAPFSALAKRGMKFGENFNLQDRVTAPEVLKPTFTNAYKRVGESIAPTRFAGGSYLTALRSVSDTGWGAIQVEPAPFWLALEDYWVQRGLLDPIIKLNASAALFEDVTPKEAKDADLKRNYRTRTWELDLEVVQDKNKLFLRGQLRNRTTRLQALGVNKAMKVNVWFRDIPADAKPADVPPPDVVYEIRGESVPGKGSLACTPQEVNVNSATKISRVAQVFDEATVPVRLVNTIELGVLDHRNKATALELPKHIEADEAANPPPEVAASDTGTGGGLSGTSGRGGGGPGPGGPPGGPRGEDGGMGGYDTSSLAGNKHGTLQAVLLGNKKRYVKRTDDVRRMPVGVAVVIDLDYTNDLMVAYTNSPLHFQITQTQWARYKGPLPGVRGASGGTGGTTGGGIGGLPGGPPGGGPLGEDGDPGRGYGGGQVQPGPGGGTGSGPVGAGAGGQGLPGGSLTNTSVGALPGEANANLCEFALFGIVSLYEQVPADAKKPGDATDPMGDPKQPDPMGGNVKPDPMTKPDPAKPQDPEKKDPEKKEPEKKDAAPGTPMPPDDGKKKNEAAPAEPNK